MYMYIYIHTNIRPARQSLAAECFTFITIDPSSFLFSFKQVQTLPPPVYMYMYYSQQSIAMAAGQIGTYMYGDYRTIGNYSIG